jgi:hypothetical protein
MVTLSEWLGFGLSTFGPREARTMIGFVAARGRSGLSSIVLDPRWTITARSISRTISRFGHPASLLAPITWYGHNVQ